MKKRNIVLAIIGIIIVLMMLTTCENIDLRNFLDELANTETWHQVQKLTAGSTYGSIYECYGGSVSVDGDYLVVGASEEDSSDGAVYIYQKSGSKWELDERIPSPASLNGFGISVDISGSKVIIGAIYNNYAYLYEKTSTGWEPIPEPTQPPFSGSGDFGTSVATNGDYAIIGAPNYNINGQAYIYYKDKVLDPWGMVEYLPLVASNGNYGFSVAISDNYAIIGDYNADSAQGAAYIVQKDNPNDWNIVMSITLSDGVGGDNLGYSVSITDDVAVVGAPGRETIYVYQREGEDWFLKQELSAKDYEDGDNFGYSTSIYGNYIIVGAPFKNSNRGAAYIFERNLKNIWIEKIKLTADDGDADDLFGRSVSICNSNASIGAVGDEPYGDSSGSVYIFERY